MATPEQEEWLSIQMPYTFVVTLVSDKVHIRHAWPGVAANRMLCFRDFKPDQWADYPAKAMRQEELCKSCLYQYGQRQEMDAALASIQQQEKKERT